MQDIGIVVIRENINTADESAAAKFYQLDRDGQRRLPSGVHQRTHQIRVGARKGGRQETQASAGLHAGAGGGVPSDLR